MRKQNLLILCYLLCCQAMFAQTGNLLNQPMPGIEPQLFAPRLVSDEFGNRDMAVSPTGDEIFYTLQTRGFSAIIQVKKINGKWNEPETASFSGMYNDLEPAFSADGNILYFVSSRPLDKSGKQKDYDIWLVKKTNDGWGMPQNLGSPVNSAKDEYYPSVAKNGNMYFTRAVEGREEDIMLCRYSNGVYDTAVSLPDAINSDADEFNAFVDPDEQYIIYSVYGKKDFGRGDLYISKKDKDGNWLPAQNLGDVVNTEGTDYCPYITPDKQYFFFTSNKSNLKTPFEKRQSLQSLKDLLHSPLNGSDNIYWIKAAVIFGK